jgi:hypothetical protein
MNFRSLSLASVLFLAAGSVLTTGCGPSASDFETFMRTPLPSTVTVMKLDGNWGADPWRCWEISPANEDLMRTLVAKWNLTPNPRAFNGVASGNHIYCKFDDLLESYSGEDSQSYRAVGVDAGRNLLVVYFYNG